MVSDAISCALHNLNTVWYNFMILYSYVEQVIMMCRVQEWQLSLSYFFSYFPLIVSDAILCQLHNLKNPLVYYHDTLQLCRTGLENVLCTRMTTHSYVEQVLTMCHVQEWQLSLSYFLSYFPCNFMSTPKLECPLVYYHNTSKFWQIGLEDVSRTRMITLTFLCPRLFEE